MRDKAIEADYVVVGAGLVGAILALTLAEGGQKVLLCAPKKAFSLDVLPPIPLTLREDHQPWLKALGLWEDLGPKAWQIQRLEMTQQYAREKAVLEGADYLALNPHAKGLAWVMHMQDLLTTCLEKLQSHQHVTILQEAVERIRVEIKTGQKGERKEVLVLNTEKGQRILAKRVCLVEGAEGPLGKQLGMFWKSQGKAFISSVYQVQCETRHLQSVYQHVAERRVYGFIPHQQEGQGWIIVTEEQGLEGVLDGDRLKSELTADWSEMASKITGIGKSWQKQSQCAYRAPSLIPGVLCFGQARVSVPPIGAQGLNRALEALQMFQTQQLKAPWHECVALDWQGALEAAWDDRIERWYKRMTYAVDGVFSNDACKNVVAPKIWDLACLSGVAHEWLWSTSGLPLSTGGTLQHISGDLTACHAQWIGRER